jgi:hypothetical protein
VGTTSLECSVLECGQVYSTLCCLLVGPVIEIVLRGVRVTIMASAFARPHCLDSAVSTHGLRRQCFPLGE